MSINKRSFTLISSQIKSLICFASRFKCSLFMWRIREWSAHSLSAAALRANCGISKSPAIFVLATWLVRCRMWLPRVLWEVNVRGLHSRIRGWMTEEAPQGERLFPAISLSLFLTTRLPQQMAPALTQRRREAPRSRASCQNVQHSWTVLSQRWQTCVQFWRNKSKCGFVLHVSFCR